MDPVTAGLILSGIEAAITYAPGFITDLQQLFASGAPTAADIATLRAKITAETYAGFVPNSDLPKSETNV